MTNPAAGNGGTSGFCPSNVSRVWGFCPTVVAKIEYTFCCCPPLITASNDVQHTRDISITFGTYTRLCAIHKTASESRMQYSAICQADAPSPLRRNSNSSWGLRSSLYFSGSNHF